MDNNIEDKKVIARILFEGDNHLCSKHYGSHIDYPQESLHYYKKITDLAEKIGATHIIGLGDFTYGKFGTLEYRMAVENEIRRRNDITQHNYYMVKGNHDSSSTGMTEYEYYTLKGDIRPSTDLEFIGSKIFMIDYGDWENKEIDTIDGNNIIATHGYFVFNGCTMPPYGNAITLNNFERWKGVQLILCGHIHNEHIIKGVISDNETGNNTLVHYLPCLARPSYTPGLMPEVGTVDILEIYEDGDTNFYKESVPLMPLEKSFNIQKMEYDEAHRENIHVDVTDIVEKLNSYERGVGSPEQVIMAMENVEMKYRMKAIELLKSV